MPKVSSSLIELVDAWHPHAKAISPWHGRSRSVKATGYGWLSFKGGGWTWGERPVLCSRKDDRLVFGLFSRKDAEREIRVSNWLHRHCLRATTVLGCVQLDDTRIFPGEFYADVQYLDGTFVDPVVLVVQSLIPTRVADLGFLSGPTRATWILETCKVTGWNPRAFAHDFARTLGSSLACLHLVGATNDILTWDNVTLAAEWTDFEWFYVPGEPLPDGSAGERLAERQWKSCIDAFEVVDRLAAFLGLTTSGRRNAIAECLSAYQRACGPVDISDDWYGPVLRQ